MKENFILFVIICTILFPVGLFWRTTICFEHLDGKWYLEKKSNIVGQWTNPIQSIIISFQNNFTKTSITGSLFTAFSKLEPDINYKTETHILDIFEKMEKRGKIKIVKIRETKARFVWEYVFTREIIGFLHEFIRFLFSRLLDKNAKPNPKFYKQFYNITFQKALAVIG